MFSVFYLFSSVLPYRLVSIFYHFYYILSYEICLCLYMYVFVFLLCVYYKASDGFFFFVHVMFIGMPVLLYSLSFGLTHQFIMCECVQLLIFASVCDLFVMPHMIVNCNCRPSDCCMYIFFIEKEREIQLLVIIYDDSFKPWNIVNIFRQNCHVYVCVIFHSFFLSMYLYWKFSVEIKWL